MSDDILSAQPLKKGLDKLGGYPEWPLEFCWEPEDFAKEFSENQRCARLLGKEIDAALEDPRWLADFHR